MFRAVPGACLLVSVLRTPKKPGQGGQLSGGGGIERNAKVHASRDCAPTVEHAAIMHAACSKTRRRYARTQGQIHATAQG